MQDVSQDIALFNVNGALAQELSMRERVLRLEDELRKYPQLEWQLTHHFSPGIYARELFIPKGAFLVGKIHLHAHLNFLVKGDISVLTEHGVKRLTAPCSICSQPGIKRAGYAHEDTIWITVHANPDNERDLEKLEERYIAPSFETLDESLRIEADEIMKISSSEKVG